MIKSLSLSALALATLGFNSAAQADISDFDFIKYLGQNSVYGAAF